MLHNMGATVAPDKSYIFTNRQAARRWYTHKQWPHIAASIPVVTTIRGLSGTISTTGKHNNAVIDQRIDSAILSLRKLRFLACDADTKASIIRTKILPQALYGIEVAEPAATRCISSSRLLPKPWDPIPGEPAKLWC